MNTSDPLTPALAVALMLVGTRRSPTYFFMTSRILAEPAMDFEGFVW